MASGNNGELTWTGSVSDFSVLMTWSEEYDISSNTSSVTITSIQVKSAGTIGYDYYPNGTIKINGVTVATLTSGTPNAYVYIEKRNVYHTVKNGTSSSAGTLTCSNTSIEHNSDGTKSITIEPSIKFYTTGGGSSGWGISGAQSITLTTIPRASSITSASNITLGNNCGIAWTPASTSFKYKINFALGSWSYTTGFISPGTTSSYTYIGYAISGTTTANGTTIYAQLPNSVSGTMTATLTTYNSSGTQIGSASSKAFTVSIPSSVVPTVGTITLTPDEITTADGVGRSILVKGKNKLTVSVSGCSAGTGSSIKSYTFSGTGISSTTTSTSVKSANNISATGSLTYTVTVTDNRNRTASKTATITCYDYAVPKFTSFTSYRCDSNGNANEAGTYIKYSLGVDFSSVNSTNNSTVKMYYKTNAASSWSQATNALTSSTTQSASAIIKNSSGTSITFDSDTTYLIYAVVTDNYSGSANSSTMTVFGGARILNIRPKGTGIALGKMAEIDNTFECRWDAKFAGSVSGPYGFSTSSDKNLKKNIGDIDADIVDCLRPVQYELRQNTDGKIHYGFIAQDIAEILSDIGLNPNDFGIIRQIVNNGENEYVLTYTEFIPLLTKKCQFLQNEIDSLRLEIENLKNNIK